MRGDPRTLGLDPSSRVGGVWRPSGSKSQAQRALVFGAFAQGTTRLEGPSEGEDVRAARALVAALGATESAREPGLAVRGEPPGAQAGRAARGTLVVGESGTLARLATALVALASRPGERWTIAADGTLLFRSSRPLFAALARAGVRLARQNLPGTWPVELVSAAPPTELELVGPVSSQEVSGLLAALAAWPETRTLLVRGAIPSAPYLAMTSGLLARFGAEVAEEGGGDGARRFRVRGPLVAPREALALEPDASAAAVALAAACLSGGELLVPGLGPSSAQGDVRIVAHLAAFGCEAGADERGLFARGAPTRGAVLDLAGEPDLAPVLAAVAAAAALRCGAASRLEGLGTLPGKESDRLAVLARGLEALGLALEVGPRSLALAPGRRGAPTAACVLDPAGDHRMAFAFALFGLLAPGVHVRDPGCVAKSWPRFWEDFVHLGAVLVREPSAG
jgi:3-phosphoshikimate 1-carboxyvinyltransferase